MSAIIIKGEDIRRARKARGMTQAALAQLVGRSSGIVSQWEKGITEVGPEAARRLAVWLAQPAPLPASKESSNPTTTLPIPPPLADIASELGIDLADLYATIGTEAVREEVKRLWQEKNKTTIDARNAYFEKNGLPLAKYRAF